jgi:lysozyme family protein
MTEDLKKYVKFVLKWEGPMGRSTNDSASKNPCPTPFNGKTGWHTVKGIIYSTWVSVFGKDNDARFFAMNDEDWWKVFHGTFWTKMKLDSISNFKVAAFVCDVGWMSGTSRGIKTLQRGLKALGFDIKDDGEIGPKTIAAANAADSIKLLEAMYKERERFFREIAVGKNSVFLKGWLNRLNSFKKVF